MGGSKRPLLADYRTQILGDAPNGLIFHDFVPFNIRKVLVRPFLEFIFEISKKICVDNFFHIQSKGGTLLCLGSNPVAFNFFFLF